MNPGYDSMADEYERAFLEPFRTPLERHAVGVFVDSVKESGVSGQVVDVGSGTGHVTAVLREAGMPVTGVDPSGAMVGIARENHPNVPFEVTGPDAGQWTALAADHDLAGVLARFSLIHVPPERVPTVLESWAERMPEGGVVMLAFQAMDRGRAVVSFDRSSPRWWCSARSFGLRG
ncbi:class I SAM-dependent methyltransferase [Kocuria salsicia]|uniref:class I SAM-dependent methyltransferase n=1 Tax=Kocuria salsicia TaxID=664639 RepID=UPI0033C5A8B6